MPVRRWQDVLPLALAGLALVTGCAAPLSAPTAPPTATGAAAVVVVATRLTARFEGPLLERDGCYFAGSESVTFAWPPEFVLERRGDVLRVTGGWGRGEVWEFRIGEVIVTGGGYVAIPEGKLAEFRVPEQCPRQSFFVFGGGAKPFQITPEP